VSTGTHATLSPTHGQHGQTLHIDFVEMLFALAAAEVAVKAGEFVDTADLGKQHLSWNYLAVVSHLVLATVLIASSWVGWGHSKSAARDSVLGTVFEKDFLELLFDVWLVV